MGYAKIHTSHENVKITCVKFSMFMTFVSCTLIAIVSNHVETWTMTVHHYQLI